MELVARWLAVIILGFAGSAAQAEDRFIQADGPVLRTAHGKGPKITLRGVNLGGWLLMEGWMCPLDRSGLKDDYSVRQTLDARFGEITTNRLIDRYEDTWITDDDLERIARLHLNTVRVPFWYRTLETEDGQPRADGFSHLDWIVEHAAQHGLYVILDMHGVPGGQCKSDTTGRVRSSAEFWSNPTDQDRAVELWKRVARHFQGNAAVAGYDLLNEPIGAPNRDLLWQVDDQLYRAVRSVDADHLISIEGCWGGNVNGHYQGWGLDVLPPPKQLGWTNVLYQLHAYEWDWKNEKKQLAMTASVISDVHRHQDWNVPVYLGEFNCMAPKQAWIDAISQYDTAGISWTIWTYKSAHGSGSDSWGLYNEKPAHPKAPDVSNDSETDISRAWGEWDTGQAFEINPLIADTLGQAEPSQADIALGGDISSLADMEKLGAVYRDEQNQPGDAIAIFRQQGMSIFRLRLFVDPNRDYNATGGATQDLTMVLALARRVKAAGAKLSIALHYSDTWADPAHQNKPAAWEKLPFDQLRGRVGSYTETVVKTLIRNGTPPDIVEVGNEITNGFLWPDGQLSGATPAEKEKQWHQFGQLLQSGCTAVRHCGAGIRIMIHISSGGHAGVPGWFFDHLNQQRLDYDLIGLSCYPSWDDSLPALKQNLAGLARFDKDVYVIETSYPNRAMPMKPTMTWPASPQGQHQFLADLIDVVNQMPGHHGKGVVWWYPESIAVDHARVWEGGKMAIFDDHGKILPVLDGLTGTPK